MLFTIPSRLLTFQEQYTFIHDVVLESITCGDTQINARDLKYVIKKLSSRDHMTGKTQFEAQFEVCELIAQCYKLWCGVQRACNFHFQVLNQVTPNPTGLNNKVAVNNNIKNRSMDYLPCEIYTCPPVPRM